MMNRLELAAQILAGIVANPTELEAFERAYQVAIKNKQTLEEACDAGMAAQEVEIKGHVATALRYADTLINVERLNPDMTIK